MKSSSKPFIWAHRSHNSAIMNLLFYYPNQLQPDAPVSDGMPRYTPTISLIGCIRIFGCSFATVISGSICEGEAGLVR